MGQQGGGAVPNPELPLIICSKCRQRRVVKRVSSQPTSFGEVFYCCPLHKKNSGCPFFYWEQDYEEHLKQLARKGELAGLLGNDWEGSTSAFIVKGEASEMDDTYGTRAAKVKKEIGGVAARQDELLLLRAICVVCVAILAVQFLMLIAMLVK